MRLRIRARRAATDQACMRYSWIASGLLLIASGRAVAVEPTSISESLESEAASTSLPAAPAAATTRIRQSLKAVYADGRPLWSTPAGPSPQARAVLDILAEAESYGLRAKDYAVSVPAGNASDDAGRG